MDKKTKDALAYAVIMISELFGIIDFVLRHWYT